MPESVLSKEIEEGAQVSQPTPSPLRVRVISDAVEDGVGRARRAIKRGRYAAEDLMDETVHTIKQHPLQTVGVTLGLALGTGFLLGWAASRAWRK